MRSMIRAVTFIVIFVLSGFDPVHVRAQEPPAGKLPPGVTPIHYQLELDVEPSQERFSGEVRIDVVLDRATSVIWLHGDGLDARHAFVLVPGGERVGATYREVGKGGVVQLTTMRTIEAGPATLVIRYSAPFGRSLKGFYNVKRQGIASAYTHFEPLAARKAFPGFDEPRFKVPFDIAVTVSGANIAVSNAPVRKIFQLDSDRRRVAFQTTKPLPTYLIALAVGEFDVVEWAPLAPNAVRSWPVPLRGIASKGKGEKLRHALQSTEAMVAILEEYFDIPYPYAKLDLVVPASFNSGGMENAGAIFYREDRILLDEKPSIYQLRGFGYLHAHELAHNWFGNLVTPVWWDDLWLNEAFATWMSGRVVHAWRKDLFFNRGVLRSAQRVMWDDRLVSARQIHQPVANNHDVVNAFDSVTYSKGGGVLSMLERYMGEVAFRDGVRRFISGHRHGVATAKEFFAALVKGSDDADVGRAFGSFLEQPGTPLVEANWSCRADGATDVTLKQSRSLPLGSKGNPEKTWVIPLCLVYPDRDARKRKCVLMSEPEMAVRLEGSSCPAWILPNEEGAAYVNYSLPDHGWAALIEEMDKLAPREKISLVSSVNAAYEAGQIRIERVVAVARGAVRSPHWDVVKAPMQLLRNVKLFLASKSDKPVAKALMRQIYKPVLDNFDLSDSALAGDEDDAALALLRSELFWFMAIDAEHADLSERLSRLAQAYVGFGSDRKLHRDVLHPNLVRAALIVATRDAGMAFVDVAIELLKTTDDAVLREHLVRALGHQTKRQTVERIWEVVLNEEVSKRNASQLLRRQGHRVYNARALFDWVAKNYDILPEKLPRSHMAWLPWRVKGQCSEASHGRVKEFFKDRSKRHRGGPRALANVLEIIELCTAFAKSQKADAAAFLATVK